MNASKWIGIGILITLGVAMVAFVFGWLLSRNGTRSVVIKPIWGWEVLSKKVLSCEETNLVDIQNIPGTVGNVQCKITFSERYSCSKADNHSDDCISETGLTKTACPSANILPQDSTDVASLSISSLNVILNKYLANLNDSGLEIAEVMEFEHNIYATIKEEESGMGVMELLVDKYKVIYDLYIWMIWD